ncbi:SMI1/KNR4 family protein [Streptomyces sp. NPDC004266]|uniref:SMI1/KNR4 family protein n=1 Tax=Streptomyces sp. NPDC004266 TaxID=3364693 RepID=UPI0036AF8297
MNVEISSDLREGAARLGAGVPYALRVLAGQLADDPDMGRPSGLPGILTVSVDGDLFDDCPALNVGYIREPDRLEIRYVTVVSTTEPVDPAATGEDRSLNPEHPDDRPDALVTGREVADAWERITSWLRRSAPDSFRALRPGASPASIDGLEGELGIRIPAALRALWAVTSGDDGVDGRGCLPGNEALMSLDAVAGFYRQQMEAQAHEDTLNARRAEEDRFTVWRAAWIPMVSFGPSDRTSGFYLDAESGFLGRWSRFNEGPEDELDTLVTYLEDVADMLEAPALATHDKPGLIGGALVWGSRLDAAQERRWQPLPA